MKFQVVCTYSRTDKRQLWRVASREFESRRDAENWKNWCITEWKLEHPRKVRDVPKFFVVALDLPEDIE